MTISVALWVIVTLAVCVLYFRGGQDLDLQDRSDAEFERFFGKEEHDAHVQAYLHYLHHSELQAEQTALPQTSMRTANA